jgi:hypothetical protein
MIDIPGRFCRLAARRSGGLGSTKSLKDGRRRLLFSPRLALDGYFSFLLRSFVTELEQRRKNEWPVQVPEES